MTVLPLTVTSAANWENLTLELHFKGCQGCSAGFASSFHPRQPWSSSSVLLREGSRPVEMLCICREPHPPSSKEKV
ncbi:hypothetical protein PAMP_005318 [Pampus punctatissimus]